MTEEAEAAAAAAESDEEKQRACVLASALTWLGTPFHDVAGIKGVGVDCAHFVARAYEEAGMVRHIEIPPYPAQWFMHRDEERFLAFVLDAGAHEIEAAAARPGDLVMYKIGRCYAHGAVIIDWPQIIHAHAPSRCVVIGDGVSGDLADYKRRFFSLWG
jgi:cell wall-associated NlpC family hydrolase